MTIKKITLGLSSLFIIGIIIFLQLKPLLTYKNDKTGEHLSETSTITTGLEEVTNINAKEINTDEIELTKAISQLFELYKQSIILKEIEHDITFSSSNSYDVFANIVKYEIDRQEITGEVVNEIEYSLKH